MVYDPDLTMTLPLGMSLVSGMNAIAHAAEGLYAQDGNPVMSLMAEEGIRALAKGMPALAEAPDDKEARALCLYGAWLCGTVLGNVGMALHHKLCHTLGGSFNLPHAETHTVVLPHALAYNSPAAPEAMARIAAAIGAPDAPAGLHRMAAKLGVPDGAARPRPEGSRPRPRLRDRARQPLLEPAADRGRAAARPAPARLGGRGAAALTDELQAAAAIRAPSIARR